MDSHGISITDQGGLAILTVLFIDFLKKSPRFRWMTPDTEKLNRWVSFCAAFFATIGLSIASHTGDWHTGGQFTVVYPSLSQAAGGLFHFAVQWGGQEVMHKLYGNHNIGKVLLDNVNDVKGEVAELKKRLG